MCETSAVSPPDGAEAEQERPERLYEVQECVYGGRAGLAPVREAVPRHAPVVGRHVDRFWRAAFHDVYVDAPAGQRAALEDGGDRRSSLCVRGAHLAPASYAAAARSQCRARASVRDGRGRQMREVAATQTLWSSATRLSSLVSCHGGPGSTAAGKPDRGSHAAWSFLPLAEDLLSFVAYLARIDGCHAKCG